jgi:hypothetical protein
MAKKRPKETQTDLGLDPVALGNLLKGKRPRPFDTIEEVARYFDALTEFARQEYANSDTNGDSGFLGFINEEIRVRISKEVNEVVSNNRFGSSLVEVLIPFILEESTSEQEARKLRYHTQFQKAMKAAQVETAHSFHSILGPAAKEALFAKYGTQLKVQTRAKK